VGSIEKIMVPGAGKIEFSALFSACIKGLLFKIRGNCFDYPGETVVSK
jgi:hypothetical protein